MGAFSCAVFADPVPLPSTVLTNGLQTNASVVVGPNNPAYPVSFSFGSGGGFSATIDGVNTTMWCVDAEEDISPPVTYTADLVDVSDIGSDPNDVHYGNVTPSQWALSIPGETTPAQRFEMATWLVSQYPGIPAGPSPANTATDQEIQTAIWEIMWNSSISSESGITFSQIQNDGTNTTNVATDISNAETFVNNPANASFFNNFAVVSGPATASGTLTSPGIQTYIVELASPVPEPASVLLFGSLIGGVVVVTRRARAKRVRSVC